MQIKAFFILTLACLLTTGCGTSNDVSLPTMTATEMPTLIPTASKTTTPTFTPEPTATITPTPTETVFALDPSFVVTDENGTPVLVDGRAQFNFEMEYDKLPDVVDLEKFSGHEAWSPDFIRWLHTEYIPKLQVGGSPLVTPFDPNTVCQVQWNNLQPGQGSSFSTFSIRQSTPCESGTFPIRKVYVFRDSARGLYAIIQQVYNEQTGSYVFRTMGFVKEINELLPSMMYENKYISFLYAFDQTSKAGGYPLAAVHRMQEQMLQDGTPLYDAEQADSAYARGGLFDPYFDDHVAVGTRYTGMINIK